MNTDKIAALANQIKKEWASKECDNVKCAVLAQGLVKQIPLPAEMSINGDLDEKQCKMFDALSDAEKEVIVAEALVAEEKERGLPVYCGV